MDIGCTARLPAQDRSCRLQVPGAMPTNARPCRTQRGPLFLQRSPSLETATRKTAVTGIKHRSLPPATTTRTLPFHPASPASGNLQSLNHDRDCTRCYCSHKGCLWLPRERRTSYLHPSRWNCCDKAGRPRWVSLTRTAVGGTYFVPPGSFGFRLSESGITPPKKTRHPYMTSARSRHIVPPLARLSSEKSAQEPRWD